MNSELVKGLIERNGITETEPRSHYKVAIEGPVCAGKSSLVNILAQNGLGTVPEYSEYVAHANRDFPKFPPKDTEAAKRNFKFFLELESRRNHDLATLPQSETALDRSIYSLLAFEAGACAITGIDIFDWAVNRLLTETELILPDHIFYLDVPPAVSRQRTEENDIPIPKFLLDERFNDAFRKFFVRLSQMYPQYVTVILAEKPLEKVADSLLSSFRLLSK